MSEQLAYTRRQANVVLGFEEESEWLLEPGCPVPKCDIRRVGATRPLWVWRRADLETFLAQRLVRPGEANPQDL